MAWLLRGMSSERADFSAFYERVHPELTGHGVWLRGGELNTLARQEYGEREFRILFARLSTYVDTVASFTHSLLYQIAAGIPGVCPDLSYLPPKQDRALFAQFEGAEVPWLLGTQSKQGPMGFDVIGFSLSLVQELINLPTVLGKSGIPLSKRERLRRPEVPLIILGGASALYSSAAWGPDAWVDGVFVGEGDQDIRALLGMMAAAKTERLPKDDLLKRLAAEIHGFILPDEPESAQSAQSAKKARKSYSRDLNQASTLIRGLVPFDSDVVGSSPVQISEGCPCFCSFCAESWDRKPYRERKALQISQAARAMKAAMGLDGIELYSFNFNMHSEFYRILWDLVPLFRRIGLKSQRFDILAHDPGMAEFQHVLQKSNFTCGLEGISSRLRRYLHKNLEEEQVITGLGAIFRSKAREIKIFLIATGLEEDADFAEFSDFVERVKAMRTGGAAGARLIFSVTPLVRFPWTPLEFGDAYPAGHYASIIRKVSAIVRRNGFEFREAADLPEYQVSQILARASDPRIGMALCRAVQKTGFVYYREIPESFVREFETGLHETGVDPAHALRGFSFEESRGKPWTRVETGVKREFLFEQFQSGLRFVEKDYCLGRSWKKARCLHCGGCPTRFHARDILLSKQERDYSLDAFKARVRASREDEGEVRIRVRAGEAARGLSRRMLGTAVARSLMLAEPKLIEGYAGYRMSDWAGHSEEPVYVTGEDVLTLSWNRKFLPELDRSLASESILARVNEELANWGEVVGMAGPDEEAFRRVLRIEAPFSSQVDAYLKDHDYKHTLRKADGGSYHYEFTPQVRRKGKMYQLWVLRKTPASMVLSPGPKFLNEEFVLFMRKAFRLPREQDWVRVRCEAQRGA